MIHQNSKEKKSPYLDKLLDWYDKTKKNDELEIRKSKLEFIQQIKQFEKKDIKNTTNVVPENISLWMRIKKTLGIG